MKPQVRRAVHSIAIAAFQGLAGAVLLAPSASQASAYQSCPAGQAIVAGANSRDFQDICDGVASAVSFLVSHGASVSDVLTIQVVEQLPEAAGPTAAGGYLESERRINVVPFSAFHRHGTWFGVPIDRAMYRALASHEAAHAIAARSFRIPNPTIQAKEYLAYVAMFSTMPSALRERALRVLEGEVFASFERFTPMLYMFDPMRFGAGAYRHFSSLAEPGSAVRDVLEGRALVD